jgi:glutaredoxin-related protein
VLLTRKYKDVQYKQVTSSEHIRHPVKEVQDWHTLELFLKYPFAQEMH